MFGRDCELLLQRLTDRGYLERIARDRGATGAPHVYRATAAAITATGHTSLASLQRFLADTVVSPPAEGSELIPEHGNQGAQKRD
jgi:hypothetical protein